MTWEKTKDYVKSAMPISYSILRLAAAIFSSYQERTKNAKFDSRLRRRTHIQKLDYLVRVPHQRCLHCFQESASSLYRKAPVTFLTVSSDHQGTDMQGNCIRPYVPSLLANANRFPLLDYFCLTIGSNFFSTDAILRYRLKRGCQVV